MNESIVFFGNERIATGVTTDTPILRSLLEQNYTIVAVVANYERSKSRNNRDLEVAKLAEEHRIPVLLPEKLSEIREQLSDFNAVAGILVAYGKIIPQSIIDIFPKGIINIHPSILPKHRGPTPLESAILNGDTETGVSIMQLAKEMDAGPVYSQSTLPLRGNETKQELADTLLDISQAMLTELLPGILSGAVVAAPQDDSQATYDQRIAKEAALLDFTKTALQLEREIRAYAEWPKSRTTIGDKEVVITKAHVVSELRAESAEQNQVPGKIWKNSKQFGFYTTSGILAIDSLKPAGKVEMSAQAFLAGYVVN